MKVIAIVLLTLIGVDISVSAQRLKPERKRLLLLINEFRIENGLDPLTYNRLGHIPTKLWAKRLEKRFEHAGSGYTCENIAINFDGADVMFVQWRESPGHRKNMLHPRIRSCAIGLHRGKYRNTNGAMFGVFRGYK